MRLLLCSIARYGFSGAQTYDASIALTERAGARKGRGETSDS